MPQNCRCVIPTATEEAAPEPKPQPALIVKVEISTFGAARISVMLRTDREFVLWRDLVMEDGDRLAVYDSQPDADPYPEGVETYPLSNDPADIMRRTVAYMMGPDPTGKET